MLASIVLGLCSAGFTVDPETSSFISTIDGRRHMFHGVNVVEKTHEFIPTATAEAFKLDPVRGLAAADMELLRSLGFNSVRLGVLWEAVQPAHGVINTTYLSRVKELVDELYTYGIYTIADAHQDVLTEAMCGEGIPMWVYKRALEVSPFNTSDPSKAFPAPLPWNLTRNPDGNPDVNACMNNPFFGYYLSYESEAVWTAIYTNTEIQGYFAESWAAVATALKDCPGLLGYELLNEPWPAGKHILSDDQTLLPMYKTLYSAIRKVDPTGLVFFEPLVMQSYEGDVGRRTDFPVAGIGGADDADKQVYAYHLYCAPSNNTNTTSWKVLCEYVIDAGWLAIKGNLAKVKLGGFMTEFGSVGDDAPSLAKMDLMLDQADDALQSWTYWTYKSFDDITTQNAQTESFFDAQGGLQTKKLHTLSRPYAQVTAGKLYRANYNRAAERFTIQYEVVAGVTENTTEVFVPALSYNASSTFWQCDKDVSIVGNRSLGTYGTVFYLKHTSTLVAGTDLQISVCTELSRCSGWGHSCLANSTAALATW